MNANPIQEKRNEYIRLLVTGMTKFQFGKNPTTIEVVEFNRDTGVVRYIDGHKDPIQYRIFEDDVDEFVAYLIINNARVHWTVGA